MAAKKELWFEAEGEEQDGKKPSLRVYRRGKAILVEGPNFKDHVCHPSITNAELVKREIFHVFGIKVASIKYP